MSTKQEVHITISGVTNLHAQLLSTILAEFLEFTGFETTLTMSSDPTDEELSNIYENFGDHLQECINTTKLNISS
ncbi:MAG: hypothetical protein EO766_11975 [Hydrotalea sp. AMD]|uniref:hypothetical protein n=1 Tax=Hydrotalea sp. AMD TaxID=2501297 RepID=UPI0010275C11|nr:hypothetical protein [Hydrotalea sp. AMD]RWZ87237.1 MAG: hypothetical protein EO766_11975 [Hydrotalea sp. AMD]